MMDFSAFAELILRPPVGYHARKDAGLCVEPCCKTPPEPDCVRCRVHLDSINKASKATRSKAAANRGPRLTRRVPPPALLSSSQCEDEPRDRSRGNRLGAYMIFRDSDGKLVTTRVGRADEHRRPPEDEASDGPIETITLAGE
jgi:hypothetical protein